MPQNVKPMTHYVGAWLRGDCGIFNLNPITHGDQGL